MTIACAVHWYESLLFLSPVALTMGAIWVTSRIEERRERQESMEAEAGNWQGTDQAAAPG